MAESDALDYLKIINATIGYIEETLFDPITLDELASNFYSSSMEDTWG